MSKVIISAIATLAAVVITTAAMTGNGGAQHDGPRAADGHDGYYVTEIRKPDDLR